MYTITLDKLDMFGIGTGLAVGIVLFANLVDLLPVLW